MDKNDSDTVATTDSTITKSDFEKQLKDRYGKDMLYEMMAQDVITKKYKVSDDDVDKELQKQKINTETNLKRIEKQWFKR